MAEEREAIEQHVQLVRERLYPAIRVDRFPDAKKLTARFERIVGDWKAGRAPDASGIIEGHQRNLRGDQAAAPKTHRAFYFGLRALRDIDRTIDRFLAELWRSPALL